MKSGLYWQIMLGLFAGIIFGISFPTTYKITDDTISHFQNGNYNPNLIQILQSEKKDFKETETEFLKRIKPGLGPEYFEKYKTEILIHSKYNPYLPYVSWIGDLFLRILSMIIVPLVVSAIISGLSNIGSIQGLGRLGIKTILYYFTTSSLAIFVGLTIVNLFKPGSGADISVFGRVDGLIIQHSFRDSLMNIIPTNIFEAFARSNLISIIFFSILFGFFTTRVNDRSRILMGNFFHAVFDIMMQITHFVIRLIPFGIFALVAVFVAEYSGDMKKLSGLLNNLGKYLFTVILALSFHAIVSLPLLMKFIFGANPWKHFKAMRGALITSFFTASSIGTLPVTMNSVNRHCGVSNKVSSFTLPLGATISLDGTALYEIVAVFFIAQAYGMELSLLETVVIIATTLLASIGSSGVPMSGVLMLSIVLTAVGLPLEGIGIIAAVDRVLEMFRTTVNVWSDSCGAVIIAKSEGEELRV
jgi:proton glutamate symport protein